ncbi:acylphosphatase [Actinomadura viridis]|uniref:acylphosphatase n=1 Tax=Actinomadura viridis TaxID=58110 RepID=A0A931DIT7_9ACTN|nr:acylphosphatase [Actinomadura viridis]
MTGEPSVTGEPSTTGGADGETARLTAWARGRVQGVGFRWWVRARALELGLAGSATNLRDGRVEVVAEGPRASCERLLELLRGGTAPGMVAGVAERWSEPRGEGPGFQER